MRRTFANYARLLKRSNVKDKTFHPLMMRMTNDPTEEAWTEAMGEALTRSQAKKKKQEEVFSEMCSPKCVFRNVFSWLVASLYDDFFFCAGSKTSIPAERLSFSVQRFSDNC